MVKEWAIITLKSYTKGKRKKEFPPKKVNIQIQCTVHSTSIYLADIRNIGDDRGTKPQKLMVL